MINLKNKTWVECFNTFDELMVNIINLCHRTSNFTIYYGESSKAISGNKFDNYLPKNLELGYYNFSTKKFNCLTKEDSIKTLNLKKYCLILELNETKK